MSRLLPTLIVALPIFAGCSAEAPSPTPAAPATQNAETTEGVSRSRIQECWIGAEIGGKDYKLLTTAEALALQPSGSISAAQADAFGACLRA